jgi:predicted DNA-binding protein
MVARITHDTTIGMSAELLASVDAWAAFKNQPRSEFCREIIKNHIKRVGLFPPAQSKGAEINPPENPLAINPGN